MGERPDWALFRSIEGLQQKSGVAASELRRLVLKEIADNALDTGAELTAGFVDREKGLDLHFIEDDGPGLDGTPEEIAELFSIRRPMRSSKLLRLPQRGALGNGLRVVAGAVLASEGSLAVITSNKRIKLRPEADGSTAVIKVTPVDHPIGTRIEIARR
jgi:DNA mismatch repair ATPase MutL